MTTLSDGTRVFVGDLVTVDSLCYGKIKKFMIDVSQFLASNLNVVPELAMYVYLISVLLGMCTFSCSNVMQPAL